MFFGFASEYFLQVLLILMDTGVAPCTTFRSHSVDRTPASTTESYSESNLKFVCKFRSGALRTRSDEDCCGNENNESVSVVLPAQCSIYQLRLRISMKVCNPKYEGLKHPKKKLLGYFVHVSSFISWTKFVADICFFLVLVSADSCMCLPIQ